MAKPRDYESRVAPSTVAKWFEDGLLAYRGKKPDFEAYYRVSESLRKTVNRALNTRRNEADQKDVQPADVHAELFSNILDAKRELLVAIEDFFDFFPQERDPAQDCFGFVKMADLLHEYHTPAIRRQNKKKPGRLALWHTFGPTFGRLVKAELLAVGCTEKLDGSDPDSVVARIGASMVSYVVGEEIDCTTFASVVRGTKRRSRAMNPRPKPYSVFKASSVRPKG
jgi:hypothetical protein